MIRIRPPSAPSLDGPLGARNFSPRLPALTMHEIVHAKVIHPYANQGAMIAIKGRNLMATSHVPLEKDQILLLRVEQTSPAPLLRLLGTMGRLTSPSVLLQAVEQNLWRQVLDTLTNSMTSSQGRALLRELLKDWSSFFTRELGPRSLVKWIEQSGLTWESKLSRLFMQGRRRAEDLNRLAAGDLKAALGRVAGEEEEGSPLIGKLLNVIEGLQCFNYESVNQTGKLLLLIPCQFSDGFWTVAQLLIHKERDETRRESEKTRSCRIVLSAQLKNLGHVRADLAIRNREIRVVFLCESPPSMDWLQAHLPALIGSLEDRGFHVHKAKCEVRGQDVVRQSLFHEFAEACADAFSTFA